MKEKLKIGVFGSAIGKHNKHEKNLAYTLGYEIAKKNFILVTGATFGLPNMAIKGAHDNKGITIGISPAHSKKDHITKYNMPIEDDFTIYTGLGFDGRNLINIRTCDAAVFVKGSIGTLNELTIAIKEEKIIGILTNSGGISERMKSFLDGLKLNFKPKIYYSKDPIELLKKISKELNTK